MRVCILSNDKLKGFERKRSWPNRDTISGGGKLQKSSFSVSGIPTEIRKQGCSVIAVVTATPRC
jgi:hypothetical protein